MFEIVVKAPTKTDDLYEFSYSMRQQRSLRSRVLRPWRRSTGPRSGSRAFGFRALNYAIAHHEVWDGLYPLFYLTRYGGPLFEIGPRRAHIRFEYPIPAVVRDFFIRRAADFGETIMVDAATNDARIEGPTHGDVLAFGGGKDSRMLLGIMREGGLDPLVIASGPENTVGVPEALVTEPVNGLPGPLADRILPSFMALGRDLYLGLGLGEAHLQQPWQRTYDMAADRPLGELSQLLSSLGMQMGLHAPANVLPYNIVQRILHDHYPDLYAGQVSVPAESRKEKNLHVSLLKIANDIPFTDHCSEPLFYELLQKFVRRQTAKPDRFGYRNNREIINREMRAIIWRKREEPLFASVRDDVPADWEGAWIDYIHTYVSPSLDPLFLDIYRQYAPTVDEAPAGTPIRRIPV